MINWDKSECYQFHLQSVTAEMSSMSAQSAAKA